MVVGYIAKWCIVLWLECHFAGQTYDCWNQEESKVSILLTEKQLFSYINELQNIYVLWIWTNCMLNISILDDLSTFEYLEIMMVFSSMYIICGVWINGVSVGYGWEFL
jgi:hypothetical protein